jgi:hypothetical protein
VIVSADESGLSQRPHRVRTWAPRGKTPVLQYCFNWKSLSAVAGLTAWNFYFRLYAGAIKSPQVVDFLNALVRAIDRPLIPVWDCLPAQSQPHNEVCNPGPLRCVLLHGAST